MNDQQQEPYIHSLISTASLNRSNIDSSPSCSTPKPKPKLKVTITTYDNPLQRTKYDEYIDYSCRSFQLYTTETEANEGTFVDDFEKVKLIENEQLYFNEEQEHGGRNYLRNNITFNLDKENNYVIHCDNYSFFPVQYISSLDMSDTIKLNEIREGTKFRIGKYFHQVHLIKINSYIKTEYCTYVNNDNKNNNNKTCRICLLNTTNDYFISPCDCKGSLGFHYLCLLKWIKEKCVIELKEINKYEYTLELKNFFCEVCTKVFPFGIYYPNNNDNNNNELIFLSLIDNLCSLNNCIVLSRSKTSWDNFDYYRQNDNKTFVVFNFQSNEITLGRSKDCSIRLNNLAVSRKHCSITLNKETKKIFLKDNDSKFGTLINNDKYSSDITLNDSNKGLTVQKGNKVYQFKYSYN